MPPNFMVRSQVPTCFLRTSCAGPGLGDSRARAAGAATAAARATVQNQRAVVIGTLPEKGRPVPGAPRPRTATRRVRAGPGRWGRSPPRGTRAADLNGHRKNHGLGPNKWKGCTSTVAGVVAQLESRARRVTAAGRPARSIAPPPAGRKLRPLRPRRRAWVGRRAPGHGRDRPAVTKGPAHLAPTWNYRDQRPRLPPARPVRRREVP